jgi:Zn-dependent protease with chaperone function
MMLWAAALTFAASLLVALAAPRLATQLPPATATMLLVGSSVASTLATAYALGTLAFTWIAQIPEVAREGDWSPLMLHSADPVPAGAAIGSGAILLAGATWALRTAVRRVRAQRRLRQSLQAMPHDGGLVIVDHRPLDAYATPAAGGRIVVTRGLLDVLGPDESRALLAHERAHLTLRHHWWVQTAQMCAAVMPLMRPMASAVGESVERWADEHAADELQDRRLVARALARAALHAHSAARGIATLGAINGQMPRRVNAMLAPRPKRRVLPAVALIVLVVSVSAAALAVAASTDSMFDHATIATTAPHVATHAGRHV